MGNLNNWTLAPSTNIYLCAHSVYIISNENLLFPSPYFFALEELCLDLDLHGKVFIPPVSVSWSGYRAVNKHLNM